MKQMSYPAGNLLFGGIGRPVARLARPPAAYQRSFRPPAACSAALWTVAPLCGACAACAAALKDGVHAPGQLIICAVSS